jgi:prepilin-type processing-associated H-X9-DG protein
VQSQKKGTRAFPNLHDTNTSAGVDFTNHLSTTIFLFADGHVKALKPSATFRGAVNMWANDPSQGDTGGLVSALQSQDAALQYSIVIHYPRDEKHSARVKFHVPSEGESRNS